MINEKYIDNYEASLKAMYLLLRKVNIISWADKIKKEIKLVEKRDVSHHLSLYGGMGSLNDIYICRYNNHKVTYEQEPWYNALFNILTMLCSSYAKNEDMLPFLFDHRDSITTANMKISGQKCRTCGKQIVIKNKIDWYIAPLLLSKIVREALINDYLESCAVNIMNLNIPDRESEYEIIVQVLKARNIDIHDVSSQLVAKCPKCGNIDFSDYRFVL